MTQGQLKGSAKIEERPLHKGLLGEGWWPRGPGRKWFKSKETAKQAEEKEFAFMSKEVAYSAISASDWLADSAVTMHIMRSQNDFTNYAKEPSKIEGISPGAVLHMWGQGLVHIEFKVGTKINTIELCDVKHTPDAPNNLISIGRLTDKGNSATFNGTGMEFKTWCEVCLRYFYQKPATVFMQTVSSTVV